MADALLKKERYAVIIGSDAVLSFAPEKDVSQALVTLLNDVEPDFFTLPVVTPVNAEKG